MFNAIAFSNVPNTSPCVKTCPNRTVTCKFDGTCNLYAEWQADHIEKLSNYNTRRQAELVADKQVKYTNKRKSKASTRANMGGTR